MAIGKRKNDISVYTHKELTGRRQELLDRITEADSYLPDSILHDDLDLGMLEFVKENLKVISDGVQIPIIPKILTIQRWGEMANNWNFSDVDGNLKLPFIAVIRKPDVQPGTNPFIQRTIPDRRTFHYATVKTWNGTQMGADVYKIPQPTAIDISYEIVIVCQKFRDLNKFNKSVLLKFSSRQAYTSVKGHYVPIILDKVNDNSPIDAIDGRRFYMQNYDMTMLGFLIDSDEFEVKPAISRMFLMTELTYDIASSKTRYVSSVDVSCVRFVADGAHTAYSVGESIGFLFYVTINGLIQQRDVDYYHIAGTSKIIFANAPMSGEIILICYHPADGGPMINQYGVRVTLANEYFTYDGSSLTCTVVHTIDSVVHLEINGLIDEELYGYTITGANQITLTSNPVLGSVIGITYFY